MEAELAKNLLKLSEGYCAARGLGEATVGRLCAADSRFFVRIREGKTFTAKKYDDVVAWFSSHWPDGAVWPDSIKRMRATT